MSKFSFSMACVHIVSVDFKGEIDDLSWVIMSDFSSTNGQTYLITRDGQQISQYLNKSWATA